MTEAEDFERYWSVAAELRQASEHLVPQARVVVADAEELARILAALVHLAAGVEKRLARIEERLVAPEGRGRGLPQTSEN